MEKRPVIALLAGARESVAAARWLARTPAQGVAVWARGSDPVPLDVPACDAVPSDAVGLLDASHAFDGHTRRAAMAQAKGAAYACIGRDPWVATPGDLWTEVDTMEQAVSALPSGARVFAATGRASLPHLQTHDGAVFLRQLTRHNDPTAYPNCTFVFGTAPFDAEGEAQLLRDLRIDVVLARNIGGVGSFPKLAAARALGLPVVLLRPPQRPVGPALNSADAVAAWVESL